MDQNTRAAKGGLAVADPWISHDVLAERLDLDLAGGFVRGYAALPVTLIVAASGGGEQTFG